MKIITLDSCGSTNAEAKKIPFIKENSHTIITSERQYKGRGSKGRSWVSMPGGLYLSLLLCDRNYTKDDCLSLVNKSALAVTETLDFYFDKHGFKNLKSFIKWPNDVLVNGKKICGILTEMQFCGDVSAAAIIGIGVNVNQKLFDGDYRHSPTSYFLETGHSLDLQEVTLTLSDKLLREFPEGLYN